MKTVDEMLAEAELKDMAEAGVKGRLAAEEVAEFIRHLELLGFNNASVLPLAVAYAGRARE